VEGDAADAWVPVGPDTASETDVDRDRFGDSGVGCGKSNILIMRHVLRPGATCPPLHS